MRVPSRPSSAFETALIAIGMACTSRSPTFAAVTIVSSRMARRRVKDTRDPFAGLHAHGTTLRLESAQFCGDLVVAFRKVWKREVARGAGVRRAVDDTPNRHANAWQRGTGLVDDGPDTSRHGLRGRGSGPRRRASGPQRATTSWFDAGAVYPCAE